MGRSALGTSDLFGSGFYNWAPEGSHVKVGGTCCGIMVGVIVVVLAETNRASPLLSRLSPNSSGAKLRR